MRNLLARLRSQRLQFWVLVVAFVLGSAFVAGAGWLSRYDLSNIDGISYISIARQYADGFPSFALNAYWSPLVSWLLAPFIAVGVDGQVAFMIVNTIAVIVGMGFGSALVWFYGHRHFLATGIFMGIYVLFGASNVAVITPDMLVTTWVVVFVFTLAVISARMHTGSRKQKLIAGIVLGLVCVLGYFTKLFLVPVFVVVLAIWLVIRAHDARRRMPAGTTRVRAARASIATLGVAAAVIVIVAAPWATALSSKYHQFTVGSSFAVNVDKKFDPTAADAAANALTLYAPPNSKAISFGEDRSLQVATGTSTSHVSLTSRVKYYVGERLNAFPFYLAKIGTIAPFAVLIIAIFWLALAFRVIGYRSNRLAFYAALVWSVYFLGYAAITSSTSGGGNSRYYWPLLVLSNLVAVLSLSEIWKRLGTDRWRKVLVAVLIALVPLGAIFEFGMGRPTPFSQGPAPRAAVGAYTRGAVIPTEQKTSERDLAPLIPAGSNIVGTVYRETLKYAYYLNARVYGRAEQGYDISNPAFQQVLRDSKIDYYILFTPAAKKPIDVSTLGTVEGSFTSVTKCIDDSKAIDEPCTIRVIKLTK